MHKNETASSRVDNGEDSLMKINKLVFSDIEFGQIFLPQTIGLFSK